MHVDGGGGGAHAAIVPTNGYANGLSASGSSRQTNGSVHSSTNGTSNAAAVAVTSTSIVAERDDGAIADDDDAISLTSELSEESSDCLTKDADVEQFDFHDVDPAYSALINFGQSISAFAAKIENLSPELQRRMDVRFCSIVNIVCCILRVFRMCSALSAIIRHLRVQKAISSTQHFVHFSLELSTPQ